MIISLTNILIVAAIGIAAWFVGKKYFQLDTKLEDKRREFVELAAKLKELGFQELPEFFMDLAVNDKSGAYYKVKTLGKRLMQGEKAILTELDDVFLKLLTIKLNTPEGRNLVETKLREVEAAIAIPATTAATPATKTAT